MQLLEIKHHTIRRDELPATTLYGQHCNTDIVVLIRSTLRLTDIQIDVSLK
jgi:hypothetical protein